MELLRKQSKSFIFRLIQDFFPEEGLPDEDYAPISTIAICLIMALAGASALLYAYAFGILSRP